MFVIVKITEVAQVRLMHVYFVMEVEKEVDLMALYLSSLQAISSPASTFHDFTYLVVKR